MDEFNDKNFYGYSLDKDPALATTSRNFEFKVLRPEQLDKAIKKVHLEKQINKNISGYNTKAHAVKHVEKKHVYQPPDRDVETELSRQSAHKVRQLSEREIDQIIFKSLFIGDYVPQNKKTDMKPLEKPKTCVAHESAKDDERSIDYLAKSVESALLAVDNILIDREKRQRQRILCKSKQIECRMPEPLWAEIIEKPAAAQYLAQDMKKTPSEQLGAQVSVPSFTSIIESSEAPGSDTLSSDGTQNKYIDSDFEYDLMKREDYKKYCVTRPQLSSVTSEELQQHDLPQFVEMPTNVARMNLRFLKNSAPMRYTELTEDIEEDQNMQIFIKSKQALEQQNEQQPETESEQRLKKTNQTKMSLNGAHRSANATPRLKAPRNSTTPRVAGRSNKKNGSHTTRTQTTSNNGRILMKPLCKHLSGRQHAGKSIEELKLEKIEIFKKMSSTQERIIEILDKLRMALLEVYIPNSTYEKNKRQKNALEFSVRFSRNFLYPLKGMIDDLRLTSPDTLNSATSNEATIRVASIYNLLQQSLSTYHKQLRFFLLDQVPQKLNCVLEMINATTKACLHKGVFDPNDTIVECMQERCNKFLEFLNNLTERHCKTNMPHNVRSPLTGKSVKSYDLKMCMNDLNMYEPKLVPKPTRRKISRKLIHKNANVENNNSKQTTAIVPTKTHMISKKPSDELMRLQIEDVTTHMNDDSAVPDSSYEALETVDSDIARKKQMMAYKFTAALQKATKNQMCEVLEPILRSIGMSMNEQNTENSDTAQTLIQALTNQFLNTLENSKHSEANKRKKRCKVVAGNVRKVVLSKNSSDKSTLGKSKYTSLASKARKQTKALRRHKVNKATAAAAAIMRKPTTTTVTVATSTTDTTNRQLTGNYADDDNNNNNNNNNQHFNTDDYDELNNYNNNNYANASNYMVSADSCSEFDVDVTNDDATADGDADFDNDAAYAAYAELEAYNCSSNSGMLSNRMSAGDACKFNAHIIQHIKEQQQQQQQELEQEQQRTPRNNNKYYEAAHMSESLNEFCDILEQENVDNDDDDEEHQQQQQQQLQHADESDEGANSGNESISSLDSNDIQLTKQQRELFWSTLSAVQPLGTKKPKISTVSSTQSSSAESKKLKDKNDGKMRKSRLYAHKKKRDPLGSPPRVPMATPSNSARSEERLEIMRRELEKIYKQQNNDETNDLVNAPTTSVQPMSPRTAKNTTSQHQMTSDVKLLRKNTQDTNNNNYNDNYNTANDNSNLHKQLPHALETLTTITKAIANNAKQQQQRSVSSMPTDETGKKKDESPYALLKELAKYLQDLPKLHEDKILQKFVQKERELYKAFEDTDIQNLMPDLKLMQEKLAAVQKDAKTMEKPSPKERKRHILENLLKQRNHFIENCSKNRFYANPAYDKPWEIFSKIANEITQEIVDSVEDDFTFGVAKFVKDFLELETQLINKR